MIPLSIITMILFSGCYDIHADPKGFYHKNCFYFLNGDAEQGNLINGLKEGIFRYTNAERQVLSQGAYRNGHRTGFWQYWHKNGHLQSKGAYNANQRNGQWEFYYPDGKVKEIRNYINNTNYLIFSWDIDGSPMVIDGNGPYKYFFEGKLREEGSYTDALPSGKWILYDENGAITKQFSNHIFSESTPKTNINN